MRWGHASRQLHYSAKLTLAPMREEAELHVPEHTAELGTGTMALMGMVALVLTAAMLWFAAFLMHIREATAARTLWATLCVCIIMGGAGALLTGGELNDNGVIAVIAVACVLFVAAIKMIYQTGIFKAIGVLLLNVMIQAIIISLYLMASLGTSGPPQAS